MLNLNHCLCYYYEQYSVPLLLFLFSLIWLCFIEGVQDVTGVNNRPQVVIPRWGRHKQSLSVSPPDFSSCSSLSSLALQNLRQTVIYHFSTCLLKCFFFCLIFHQKYCFLLSWNLISPPLPVDVRQNSKSFIDSWCLLIEAESQNCCLLGCVRIPSSIRILLKPNRPSSHLM